MTLARIVSGAQTGADLAALDAAIAAGFPHGGWVPEDRNNEAGVIPSFYGVRPVPKGGYATRMRKNIEDSDASVIFYRDVLEGGTAHTAAICMKQDQPFKLVDVDTMSPEEAARRLSKFVTQSKCAVLNVAGPRASKDPGIYDYVHQCLSLFLARVTTPP